MLRCAAIFSFLVALPLAAQLPPGVPETIANLSSEPGTKFAFTLDRTMLEQAQSLFGPGSPSSLGSVTIETYHFKQPTFYTPEAFAGLVQQYQIAGWKHLVNAKGGPAESAQPTGTLTDLWLHYQGTEINDVTVLLRGQKQMNVIEISGVIRPLDLLHLAGHFGIPKVDPSAVMVPAPAGPPAPGPAPSAPPPSQ